MLPVEDDFSSRCVTVRGSVQFADADAALKTSRATIESLSQDKQSFQTQLRSMTTELEATEAKLVTTTNDVDATKAAVHACFELQSQHMRPL